MKKYLIITGCLILFSFLSGCVSSKITQPGIQQSKPDISVEKEIKDVAVVDLPQMMSEMSGRDLPQIITATRKKVNAIVSEKKIDALSFIINENTPDILSHLVAEAKLIKPYLVIAIEYKDNPSKLKAENYRNEGLVDLVMQQVEGKNSFPVKVTITGNNIPSPENVFGLDLSAFFQGDPGGKTVKVNNGTRTLITDSEGKIGFITRKSDTIALQFDNRVISISTADWNVPFRYAITSADKAERRSPWVEFRSMPAMITDVPEFDLLCKTEYPAKVSINGDSVKQYKTGIFFNRVTFKEGPNRVRATAITLDSLSVFYESEFIYRKTDRTRKPYPLWINEKTVEPASALELLPDDVVRVSFQGSLGQEAFVEVNPGKLRIKCSREDLTDQSLYKCEIPLRRVKTGKPAIITLELIPGSAAPDKKPLRITLKQNILVRQADEFPYAKVARENSRLTYNLGAPRLGGPIRSELGPGVVFKINGKFGDNYRVTLSNTEEGFISQNDVELMPSGTVRPGYFITSMSCGPSRDADILTIPYSEPVPYEVYPDPDQKRIVITLFGVGTSSTWITHMAGRKIIDKVTWQQTTPETYQIFVNLNTVDIWGYSFRQEGKRLVLRLRYPPVFDLKNAKPLTGLKIAIEAGHGGSGMGAIGLSGLVEKEINLDLSMRLGELCRSMGAEVVQVRDSDKDMGLIEKRNIAISSGADLLICIHANAGGRGYLSVAGTSTYYNNPFWAPMADFIYNRLLDLGLKEFGVVGSFNYTVIRASELPAILVEQAFMTHAGDEEKLADPQFRQQEAQKIYEGVLDYLSFMKKK